MSRVFKNGNFNSLARLSAFRFYEIYLRISDEVRNERVCRFAVNRKRSVILLEHAVVDKAYLGRERHCLHLVMRNIYKRTARIKMKSLKLTSHFKAKFCVKV